MSFTFKNHKKETGLASVGNPWPDVDIKYKKEVVGLISAPNYRQKKWKSAFTVKTESDWGWIFLTHETDTLDEMKQYLKDKFEALTKKYTFHVIED